MYRKLFILAATAILLFPASRTMAAEPKAAFVRNDGLWLKTGEHEHRIVQQHGLSRPAWSYDGSRISYTDSSGKLWVYDTLTTRKRLVYHSPVTLPQWSPTENTIAFRAYSILNIRNMESDLSSFQNVADGTENYSWTRDGSGFIVSSNAQLTPSGWTQVSIYTAPKNAGGDHSNVKILYTLPAMSDNFFAIGTSSFRISNSGKWIAFIACPTASYSADTNFLSVLSAGGQNFEVAGKMVADFDWMKWSPDDDNKLAFIEGEGRLPAQNKRLTVYDVDTSHKKTYTPSSMADGDFTWNTRHSIVVSRAKESGWNEKQHKRNLVVVDLIKNTQNVLTTPNPQFSSHSPVTLADGRIAWEQSGTQHDIIVTRTDAAARHTWIKNITSSQWAIYGAR